MSGAEQKFAPERELWTSEGNEYLKSRTGIVQFFFTSISKTISITCKSGNNHLERLARHSSNIHICTSLFVLYATETDF
jgi:hypothetical protein